MVYTLSNKCCKRTILVQVIIEDVVTCFLEHSVETALHQIARSSVLSII